MWTIILNRDCILLNISSGFLQLSHIWNFDFINSYFICCPSSHRLPNFFFSYCDKILGWKQLKGENVDFRSQFMIADHHCEELEAASHIVPWVLKQRRVDEFTYWLLSFSCSAQGHKPKELYTPFILGCPNSINSGIILTGRLQVCSTNNVRFGQVNN